jgi:acetolactate synthase-1/2/3 large subunit
VIFGIGCSFTQTNYGVAMPKGKVMIQATLDPADLAKDIPIDHGLTGDAGLTLDALIAEVKDRLKGKPRGRLAAVTKEIATHKAEWMAKWMPRLTQTSTPLSP